MKRFAEPTSWFLASARSCSKESKRIGTAACEALTSSSSLACPASSAACHVCMATSSWSCAVWCKAALSWARSRSSKQSFNVAWRLCAASRVPSCTACVSLTACNSCIRSCSTWSSRSLRLSSCTIAALRLARLSACAPCASMIVCNRFACFSIESPSSDSNNAMRFSTAAWPSSATILSASTSLPDFVNKASRPSTRMVCEWSAALSCESSCACLLINESSSPSKLSNRLANAPSCSCTATTSSL
mmetsp:Transcript_2113/g.4765  ORF Transcript_2113/g.4765 Transcript_2113/m.4765 type:complete len:246 (-) Transcript_2113:869-1606(-)